METQNVQELVEKALEAAIESLDLIATDEGIDRQLRETQSMCNAALVELRGYGHEIRHEDWHQN